MFHLGDKVKLSDFYLANYCGVDNLKERAGEVVGIEVRYVPAETLMEQKEAYQRFFSRYGKLDRYESITLLVKYPDINMVYIMSQFGVEPVK
ncbi:MAG TPA: hypothetical protein DCP92_03470 [Nitrospiraceae bacterium]|jgi:hypothetical protein|nr:hypothetical protein [Nitrospiraceae bacterium]